MPIDQELLAAHVAEFEFGCGPNVADVDQWSDEELLYRIRYLEERSGGSDQFDALLSDLQGVATVRGILS